MVKVCLIIQCYYLSKKRKKATDDLMESSNIISPHSPIYHIPVDSFTTPVHLTPTSYISDPDWRLPQQYNLSEAIV